MYQANIRVVVDLSLLQGMLLSKVRYKHKVNGFHHMKSTKGEVESGIAGER